MRSRIMLLFDVFAIVGILVIAGNITLAQLVATIAGSDALLIHLNGFGEQTIEAIIFPLTFICGIAALVRAFRRWRDYDKG